MFTTREIRITFEFGHCADGKEAAISAKTAPANVRSMTQTADGSLWSATDRGISCLMGARDGGCCLQS
jgi:hypothetical protein